MKTRTCLLATMVSLALLSACDAQPTDGADAAPPAAADTGARPGAPGPAPQAPAGSGAAGGALWRGGQASPLDIQVPHPNGVILQLTSLQSRPLETLLGVRVVNGRDREVHLNRHGDRRGYIVMESGERIYLSPPPGNTDLTIQGAQSMEGELVFLGRLPRGDAATLVLNQDGSTDSTSTVSPKFQIELPVAGGFGQATP